MDETDYGELLYALIGELAAREFSLKLARQCGIIPRDVAADEQYEIPTDYDLCAHLPLDVSGRRAALLLRSDDARVLVAEAQRRGTLARPGPQDERHQSLSALLAEVLARSCALLGFLGGEGLHLRGVTVQDVDTPPRRTAHQIAFRRQEMVSGLLSLETRGLDPIAMVLLLPDGLFGSAAVSLADPEHLLVTDDLFLEHAPAVGQEVEAWVDELLASEEEAAEGSVLGAGDIDMAESGEPAEVGSAPDVTALSELLEEVLRELPQDEQDVVLQSPEDLIFPQLFFPQMLAHVTRQALGCTIRVQAVEMASLSMSSMCEEPAGLLAQIVFDGGFQGDTCMVFPEGDLTGLACQFECDPHSLVQLLTGPGLAFMGSITDSLPGEVLPPARVDFSSYQSDGDQYALRIRYEMLVEAEEGTIRFVQYASPGFVNRLVSALAGEDTEVLKASSRNLMLSFLSLNALIGAVAVADPARAGEWIGPILGGQYVPLYRPGDDLPDMYDFDVLGELPRGELKRLLEWPPLANVEIGTLARALRFTGRKTRRKILEAGHKEWRQRLTELDRARDEWAPKDLWDARCLFAEVLHTGIANSGVEATVAMLQHLGWRKHRLSLAWRLRGAEVLQDGIFIVPFMLDFDTLSELSNRDMTVVLERWVLGKVDLDTLGCALSRPGCPVLPRALRNVSARRREDIIEAAQRQRPEDEVLGAQHFLAEHVHFAALKGIIHPPAVIREQIDRFVALVDEELDGWCGALLQDRTYARLLGRLSPTELGQLQRLVGREEVLWSLQGAAAETTWPFMQSLGDEARIRFEEDLDAMVRREKSAQRRVWRTTEARLLIVDAARLMLQCRTAAGR